MAEPTNPPRWLPEMDQQNKALVDYLMRRQMAIGGQVHLDCFLAALVDDLDTYFNAILGKVQDQTFKERIASTYNGYLRSIFDYMKENEAAIKLGAPQQANGGLPPGFPRGMG